MALFRANEINRTVENREKNRKYRITRECSINNLSREVQPKFSSFILHNTLIQSVFIEHTSS